MGHPDLYQSPWDWFQHASAAFLSYAAIAAALWSCAYCIRAVSRIAESSLWWRTGWQIVVCFVAAFIIRRAILAKIDVLALVGRWVYGLAIPLGAATVIAVSHWMDRPLPWRGWLSGAMLLCAAVLGQVLIQRSIWPSPAAPPVLLLAIVVVTCFGGILCASAVGGVTGTRRTKTAGLALLMLATALVGVRSPGLRLRKAILVHGGVERLIIRGVLWPVSSRLGFRPGTLWRDDGAMAATTAYTGESGSDIAIAIDGRSVRAGELGPQEGSTPALVTGARRNLVWILIDTVRADALMAAFEAAPELRAAYADFTWYWKFRSCSSMTHLVLSQTLGNTSGRPGLLSDLNSAGYETARFGAYPAYSPQGFSLSGPEEPTQEALGRARAWLVSRQALGRPVFAFIHLRGGHDPVRARGNSDRDRYQRAVASAALAASDLLASIPSDWLVVVSGDHGEGFGEHGMSSHANSLYEELLRAPVLVRGHGAPAGRNDEPLGCPQLVGMIRRGLGGLPYASEAAPFHFATLDNRDGFPRDHQAALTIGKYKSIWNIGADTQELYDLSHDDRERIDLAEAKPEVSRSFMRAFRLLTVTGRAE